MVLFSLAHKSRFNFKMCYKLTIMGFESFGSYEEVTPIERAQELAEEVWGSQYDEAAMRRDGLNPYLDRYGLDGYRYRQWDTADTEGKSRPVKRDDYVYDEKGKGFRRVLKDDYGNPYGLGKLFRDKDGFEDALPKYYSF
jgi:hypothetical protein